MNLYKINKTHYSQKDNETGIQTYLIAKNDKEVYKYLVEAIGLDYEEDYEGEEFDVYDENDNIVKNLSYREKIILHKGWSADWDEWGNLYYGLTLYDWEFVADDIDEDIGKLTYLGIADVYKEK